MKSAAVAITGLLAATAAISCSSNGKGSSEFVAAYKDAFCTYYVRCGELPDRASCESSLGFESSLKQLSDLIDSGRVVYDSSKGSSCFDRLANAPCVRGATSDPELTKACEGVLAGTVAAGGACLSSNECMGDASCVKQFTSCGSVPTSCCMGTCQARMRAAVGQPCNVMIECNADAYCERMAGSSAGTCRARKPAGQPCTSSTECAYGTSCEGTVSQRSCVAPAKDGEACTSSNGCLNLTSFCDPVARKCQPRAKPQAACSGVGSCVSYASCINGVCQARPRIGESCSIPDGGVSSQTLSCLGGSCMNGMCTARPETVCAAPPDAGPRG